MMNHGKTKINENESNQKLTIFSSFLLLSDNFKFPLALINLPIIFNFTFFVSYCYHYWHSPLTTITFFQSNNHN